MIFIISNFIMEASKTIIDFWLQDQANPSSQFFADLNNHFDSFSATFKFLIFSNIALTSIRSLFCCFCALSSGKTLFDKFNSSLIFSKMKFYDRNSIGRILNRISDDISMIDDSLPWSCHIFMEKLAYSLGYPLIVLIQFPYLVIFAGISIGLVYLVQRIYRVANREVARLHSVN